MSVTVPLWKFFDAFYSYQQMCAGVTGKTYGFDEAKIIEVNSYLGVSNAISNVGMQAEERLMLNYMQLNCPDALEFGDTKTMFATLISDTDDTKYDEFKRLLDMELA